MYDILKSLNVSKAAAARYFGVSRGSVDRWCRGRCPVAVMMVLEGLVVGRKKALDELAMADGLISRLRGK